MISNGVETQQTTDYKIVIPFYIYAAFSFLIATFFLFVNSDIALVNYFNPNTLAITHLMALGWGTMIILGSAYQLLPVLLENKLESELLAYSSFFLAAMGIPFLVYGFYQFNLEWNLQLGAILVNLSVLCFVINVFLSIFNNKNKNVHAWFIVSASLWLLSTTLFGLILVYNFTWNFLPKDSIFYLSIHAHLGFIGWFLLLVIGVGSRLIPMFLISKFSNDKMLWQIFILINFSLVSFVIFKLLAFSSITYYISILSAFLGITFFGIFCRKAYQQRIRKSVDQQMKTSLISVAQMILPILALLVTLFFLPADKFPNIAFLYGFCIFFGWLTAIILGMTFKTLPFIIWNKVYHNQAHLGSTPAPKDLFNEKVYEFMLKTYLIGFTIFIVGIISSLSIVLKIGAFCLLLSALLYVYNTSITLLHQSKKL